MKGYAETAVFSVYQREAYARAVALVDQLPTPPLVAKDEKKLRCHELARAIGRMLDLQWVDGKYGMVAHTWLMVPRLDRRICHARHEDAILDVYSPGQLPMVQLVDGWIMLPETKVYVAGDTRTDIDEHKVDLIYDVWCDKEDIDDNQGI